MARWGRVDYRQLERFQRRLEQLTKQEEVDKFCEDCAKELAARLLRKVIKRTPVGQYPAESGKTGGTLRRGWKVKNGKINVDSVRKNSIKVEKQGHEYVVTIFNDVFYAPYVEFGHRTANHKSWVDGRFMLTISESEIQSIAPALLQKNLQTRLQEVFRG